MEMWVVGVVLGLWVLRQAWKAYTHPAHTLGRQAANMDWVADGREDDNGFKNVRYKRDSLTAVVPFRKPGVVLRVNGEEKCFRDFVEVERWLGQNDTSEDHSRTSIEDPATTPNPDLSFEKYLQQIEGHLELVGHNDNVLARCAASDAFSAEVLKLYSAGFNANKNYKFVALAAAQAAADWIKDPEFTKEFMRSFGNNLFNEREDVPSDDEISEYHEGIYSSLRTLNCYGDFLSISNRDTEFKILSVEAMQTGQGRGIDPEEIGRLIHSAVKEYQSEPILGRMILRDDELIY